MKIIKKYSAGGLVFSDGKVLTIKVGAPYNEIVFPKGGIEENESAEKTAVREVFEETGYNAHIVAPLGTDEYEFAEEDGKHYYKKVTFFIMALDDKNQKPTPNRTWYEKELGFENLWLSLEQAKNQLSHQSTKELLEKAVKIINARGLDL